MSAVKLDYELLSMAIWEELESLSLEHWTCVTADQYTRHIRWAYWDVRMKEYRSYGIQFMNDELSYSRDDIVQFVNYSDPDLLSRLSIDFKDWLVRTNAWAYNR